MMKFFDLAKSPARVPKGTVGHWPEMGLTAMFRTPDPGLEKSDPLDLRSTKSKNSATPNAECPTNETHPITSSKPVPRPDHFLNSEAFLWILIAIGILLRTAQFLANRSLWLDECFLS